MSILVTSISAVLPYLVYLCIGHYAHRFHLMDDSFFKQLNTLLFRVFYPITMFVNTYTISFSSALNPSFLLFVTMLLVGVCWCQCYSYRISSKITEGVGQLGISSSFFGCCDICATL